MKEVEALFERLQAGGITLEPLGVVGQVALEIAQERDRLFVEGEQADRFGIDPFQILQRAAERAGLNGEGIVIVAQLPQRSLGEFEQPGGVTGQAVLALEFRFLVGAQSGGGDLARLVAEQVQLLRVGFLVHNQRGLF